MAQPQPPKGTGVLDGRHLATVALAACVLLGSGCGTGTVPGDAMAPCSDPPGPEEPVECFQACTEDADCVYAASLPCCGCSEGGMLIPIQRAYRSEWSDARRSDGCGLCATWYLCDECTAEWAGSDNSPLVCNAGL